MKVLWRLMPCCRHVLPRPFFRRWGGCHVPQQVLTEETKGGVVGGAFILVPGCSPPRLCLLMSCQRCRARLVAASARLSR